MIDCRLTFHELLTETSVCGYTGIIGDQCPCCGRREGERIAGVRIPRAKTRE